MIYLLSDLDFCFKLFATPRSLTKVVHLSAHAFSVSLGAIFEIAKMAFKVTLFWDSQTGAPYCRRDIHSGIGLGCTQPVRRI
jgi:hypothetical protein